MKPFKIRCSAIGQIMTEQQGKTPRQRYDEMAAKLKEAQDKYEAIVENKLSLKSSITLAQKITLYKELLKELDQYKDAVLLSGTCKAFLEGWLKSKLYNRKKEFHSKYTDKGNIVEDNSLDFAADKLGYGMLIKNEEFLEDDFMNGTPDALPKDFVIDVKNSWDPFTFPLFDKDTPNEMYWWQLQGYMHLAGRDRAQLIYTLMDTPAHLIEREARAYSYRMGYGELEQEMYEEFVAKMTYPDVPDHLKIKKFDIEKDPEAIERIKQRVEDCRVYLDGLMKGVKE